MSCLYKKTPAAAGDSASCKGLLPYLHKGRIRKEKNYENDESSSCTWHGAYHDRYWCISSIRRG